MWNTLSSSLRLPDWDEFAALACIESSVLIVTLSCLFIRKPFFSRLANGPVAATQMPYRSAVLLAVAGWLTYLLFDVSALIGSTYDERNQYNVWSAGTDLDNTLGPLSIVLGLLSAFGFASLLVHWPDKKHPYAIVALGWLLIASVTGRNLANGVGIFALLPIMMICFMAKAKHWPKRRLAMLGGAIGLLTATVGEVATEVVREQRHNAGFNGDVILRGSLDHFRTERDAKSVAQDFIERTSTSLFMKFDGFTGGCVLLRGSGEGAGGLKPFLGSLLGIVPRVFLPDKPVPGSADGTYLGVPARIAARLQGMGVYGSMIGVSSGAIAIWQLGYYGLPILIVANAVLLVFLNSLLLSKSVCLHALALYVIALPAMLNIFPSPDAALMSIERALVIYAIIAFFASRLRARKSHLSGSQAAPERPAMPLFPDAVRRG
jgi:hypothetical protein